MPLAPPVIVIQETRLAALQTHPPPAVTDLVHRTAEPDHVELARLVLAEGGDVRRGIEEDALAAAVPGEYLTRAVVPVDVRPDRERTPGAPVDVAAGDGATVVGVVVVEDREGV